MTKAQLTARVAAQTYMSKAAADAAVNAGQWRFFVVSERSLPAAQEYRRVQLICTEHCWVL